MYLAFGLSRVGPDHHRPLRVGSRPEEPRKLILHHSAAALSYPPARCRAAVSPKEQRLLSIIEDMERLLASLQALDLGG